MGEIVYSKGISEKYSVDICVAGGGPSGIAAAVAARAGCGTRDISVVELQRRLRDIGGFLPNV